MNNLENRVFGNWKVLERAERGRRPYWLCECRCGTLREVREDGLLSGKSCSCGCLGKEHRKMTIVTHGCSETPLYKVWSGMKQRCYNPNAEEYHNYGARGISVCDEWLVFENFQKWALDNGYAQDLTLDREDNNGNYCPANCRWVTQMVQQNNKRTCVYVTYQGVTRTIAQWARLLGFTHETLRKRIVKNKWSVERALTTPTMTQFRR